MKILSTIKTFFRMISVKIWLKTPAGKTYAKKYTRQRKMELSKILRGEENEN